MKKLIKQVMSICTSLLIVVFALSCEKAGDGITDKEQPKVTISGLENSELSPYGEYRTLNITSNTSWKLISNVDWVKFSRESGNTTANLPVVMTVDFNFFDAREATLTLLMGDEKQVVKMTQDKWVRPTTKYQVGDPEVTFDESKFDPSYIYYKQMMEWRKAGVPGGVPHLEDVLAKVTKTFDDSATCNDIKTYFSNNRGKEICVLLKNGNYHFDEEIRLWSNATLVGESREGVVITAGPEFDGSRVINFYAADKVAVRNLTINGGWLNEDGENFPKYAWVEELEGRGGNQTINFGGATNSYVDNVNLFNNASHPICLNGSYNTVRNVNMVGSFCKSGGCQGYFFIDGNHQLITNCQAKGLRHLSFQNSTSTLNVLYDNDLEQEVTFHGGDGGDILVEYNRVYLAPTMDPAYNAVMGPWSSQHWVGGLNMIYRNKCKEDNIGRGGVTPWSDLQLYLGPHEVSIGTNNPNRYINFSPTDPSSIPPGGTLYPVILD